MSAAVLFNLYEFRTGVWLAKAYVTGVDAAGLPREVHDTARINALAGYGIEPDGALRQALSLAEALRDKAVAEHFRQGARKVPTLAGLIADKNKDRGKVLTYLQHQLDALLGLCQREGYLVAANLDTRSAPLPQLLRFVNPPLQPELEFTLHPAGLTYALQLIDAEGTARTVRSLDPRILTLDLPEGWLLCGKQLVGLAKMKGDAVRPFLSRDTVEIPTPTVGRYLREFVAPALRRHRVQLSGVECARYETPDAFRIAARAHPFSVDYHIYVHFQYGPFRFAFGDSETTAAGARPKPPFRLSFATRDATAEGARIELLRGSGLSAADGVMTVASAAERFANLRWLLDHANDLRASGWTVEPPEYAGKVCTEQPGTLAIDASRTGDWLELTADVRVGDTELSFASLVRNLQTGERAYELPDGSIFLILETWFATYGPGLRMARVRGERVRMARSQAPLLDRAEIPVRGKATAAGEPAGDIPPTLRATLRPYQAEGIRWLIRHYHDRLGACLADDMGLGKTLQTIAVLLYAKERVATEESDAAHQMDLFGAGGTDNSFLRPLRALVVVPASLVYNWAMEIRKFAPSLNVLSNIGTRRTRDARVLGRHDVILTTYQTALRDQAVLSEVPLQYVVLDESQQIKNRRSKAFRALTSLEVPHRISLSGTPIENSLSDLWSQMQFINPGLLGSYAFFQKTFMGPIELHDDELRKRQLRELVDPYLLRRTKADVAPDLPDLDVQLCYCDMTKAQRRRYESERSAARNALLGADTQSTEGEGRHRFLVIQALTRLRQLANHPVIVEEDYTGDSGKWSEVMEQWDTLRRAGHKVLIFSSMVSYLQLFREELDRQGFPYAWLTGAVSSRQRAREVERFQREARVQTFFISIKAGGTGLNLTAADYVFILDPWWNPTTEEQAVARAHRIGREGKVIARKFITRGTLEEKIYLLQQRKRQLAEDIIGKGDSLELDQGEIAYLLGTEE